jgi:hypothetical protein
MIYLLQSKLAKIILSVIWGLGLASLFKRVCHDRNCIIYRAADPKVIPNNIYTFDKKCYQFNVENTNCVSDTISS